MFLRMKITLAIWHNKNTSIFKRNGGFIQISKVLILCHWGIDLISSTHCLPCNDRIKKQEKNHWHPLTLTNTNNGRHAVHLLHGGIGKVHGGVFINNQLKKKCKKRKSSKEFRTFSRPWVPYSNEHYRDEEGCRRWDARADEDHTHHFTEQDFYTTRNGGFSKISKVLIPYHWEIV